MRFLLLGVWIVAALASGFLFAAGLAIVGFESSSGGSNSVGVLLLVSGVVIGVVLAATWTKVFSDKWPNR